MEHPIANRRFTAQGKISVSRQPYSFRLFAALAARLKRLAVRRGVPVADSEDCAQDAFVEVLRRHPEWEIEDPGAQAWLGGVVHKKAIDHHRRRNPDQLIDEDTIVAPQHDDEGEPDGESRRRTPPEVLEALNRLTPLNRKILILHAQDELDHAAIGEIVGLTPAQVRARYSRALQQVRDRLASDPRCTHDWGGGGSPSTNPSSDERESQTSGDEPGDD